MKKITSETAAFASAAFSICSSVFNNTAVSFFPDDFNWKGFTEFCSCHKILNIVAYGMRNYENNIPDVIRKSFENTVNISMMKEAQRTVEIELLCDDFEENSITHMVMKGFVIKELYPQPFLRSMSDVDILIGDNLSSASKIMLNRGFSFEGEAFLHDIYTKGKLLAVELHKALIDESLDEFYGYFGSGFERAELSDGCKFRYNFSAENFYIFLIAHMAKHYKISGTGIRSVCDIYVYNKAYGSTLDYTYISEELEKIGLKIFEKKMRELADEWFSGSFSGDFDAVSEYIVSAGVYGDSDNHELNSYLLSKEKDEGKIKYILKYAFPNMEYMTARYDRLKKYPFLLPYYWIKRVLSTLFKSRGSIRYRYKGVAESDNNDDERFTLTGLK